MGFWPEGGKIEAGCEQMPTEECGGTCGGGLKSLRFSGTREPKLQGYDVWTWGGFWAETVFVWESGAFLKLRNDFPGRQDTRNRNPRKTVTHYLTVAVPALRRRERAHNGHWSRTASSFFFNFLSIQGWIITEGSHLTLSDGFVLQEHPWIAGDSINGDNGQSWQLHFGKVTEPVSSLLLPGSSLPPGLSFIFCKAGKTTVQAPWIIGTLAAFLTSLFHVGPMISGCHNTGSDIFVMD